MKFNLGFAIIIVYIYDLNLINTFEEFNKTHTFDLKIWNGFAENFFLRPGFSPIDFPGNVLTWQILRIYRNDAFSLLAFVSLSFTINVFNEAYSLYNV